MIVRVILTDCTKEWTEVQRTGAIKRLLVEIPDDGLIATPERILEGKKKRKPDSFRNQAFEITPGNDLLSHTVTHIVPSALRGLSALFVMGRGISPAV